MTSDVKVQDFLATATDAIITGDADLDDLGLEYGISIDEVASWRPLLHQLNDTLVPVQPSARFSEQLKLELMGEETTLLWRIRRMPARVQMAAVLALLGGFALILRGRFVPNAGDTDTEEIPAPLR